MICPRCAERPVMIRRNGRPLPACAECWGDGQPIGSRSTNAHGYVRIKTESGWRFEHIVVAESVLGRPLHPDEQVGWADGDRGNNAPENLTIAVTRTRPLVEAPKRARIRSGEKHQPRVEIRLDPFIREQIAAAATRLNQTFAGTVAAYVTTSVLDELPEEDRIAFWVACVREFDKGNGHHAVQ